jgi:hypothetical protein
LTVTVRPLFLGEAGHFATFGGSAATISVLPVTITGDIGLGPSVTSTAFSGFAQTLDGATGQFATSPSVTGKMYAFDYLAPTPAAVSTASIDMVNAYNDALNRPNPDFHNLAISAGQVLVPGLYKWDAALGLPAGSITLSGGPDDVWIFQVGTSLTTAANSQIQLVNPDGGALPDSGNIFWQLGTSMTTGATSHFEGVVLAGTAITLGHLAAVNGRLLAQTAVTLDANTVTQPAH